MVNAECLLCPADCSSVQRMFIVGQPVWWQGLHIPSWNSVNWITEKESKKGSAMRILAMDDKRENLLTGHGDMGVAD